MSETPSAQPLTLFQSPVMAAVERLLVQLARRVAGPQSQFGSRNLNFVERLLSRRLDTLGLRPDAAAPVMPRAIEPQRWLLPRSWVPSPTELHDAEQPATATPGTTPRTAAAPRRQVVAPLPPRQQIAPSLPLPLPPVATPSPKATPAVAAPPQPAAEKPAPAMPQAAPAMPQAAPVAPVAAPPLRAEAPSSPAAAPIVPPPVASIAPPPVAPAAAPAAFAPAAAPAAFAPAAAVVPPVDVAAAPVAAPQSIAALPTATASFTAPVSSPPEVVAASSLPETVVALSSPEIARPTVSAAAPTLTVPAATPLDAVPEAPAVAAAPAERRVRDWLTQFSVALPPPTATSPSTAVAAPRYSALARAFAHLGFADTQLVRSPAQRLAAAELAPSDAVSAPKATPAMPMVATPEWVAPSRQRQPAITTVPPSTSAALPALASPIARSSAVPPLQAPATTVRPPVEAAAPVQSTAAMSPLLAQLLPPVAAPVAAPAAPIPTAVIAAEPPLASFAPISPARPMAPTAAPSRARPASPTKAVAPSSIDLGILASPLFPALSAAHVEPVAPPLAAGTSLPVAWSAPGALASHFDRFATARRSRTTAAAPFAGAPELREWAVAPGVPATLSRALSRETSYTPARWQPVAATLPYLPVPSAAPLVAEQPKTLASRAPQPLAVTPPRSLAASNPIAAPSMVPLAPGLPPPPRVAAPIGPVSSMGTAATTELPVAPSVQAPAAISGFSAAAPQPWREAGGAATLAELFAAGIGLGSGAVATLAQTFSKERGGSLISSWLEPILRSTSTLMQPVGSVEARSGSALPLAVRAEPALSRIAPAPLIARLAERTALAPTEMPLPPRPRFTQTAPGMVFLPSPTAAQPRPLASSPSFFQPGAMGLVTERLASVQGPRVAAAGPSSPAAMLPWAQAPGVSEVLARTLARESTTSTERFQQLSSALPYLSAPQPPTATSPVAPMIARTAASAPQVSPVVAPAPALRAAQPASVAVAPSLRVAQPAGVAVAPSLETARPWQLPGGAAALAELFAAGVGLGSGAAGWLAESTAPSKGSLVADWLRPFLRPAAAAPVSGQEWRRLPTETAPLSYVPWTAPGVTPREEAPRREAGSVREVGRPQAARATSLPSRTEAVRERPPLGPLGGLSAFAEQFAAVHGLDVSAPRSEDGRFVPVVGGMVFVPRAEAPRRAEGEPAIATPRPQLPPPPAWSRTGGMSLRSELFATQQVARSAPPSLRELDRASDDLAAAPQRFGFSGSGGLIYLGPNALQQQAAPGGSVAGLPSLSMAAVGSAAAAPRALLAAPTAASRVAAAPRLSILDLALAGLLAPSGATGGATDSAGGFAFSWLPPAQAAAERAAQTGGFLSSGTASPFAPASLRSEESVARRTFAGGLPLPPPAEATAGGRAQAAMQHAPTTAAATRGAAEVASRFAAPMLTSFPRSTSDGQTPRMIWPQAMASASERLQQLLSILPSGWVPPPSVLAAVSASGVPGMPFWQRMPAMPAVSPATRPAAQSVDSPATASPMGLPLPVSAAADEPRRVSRDDDDEEMEAPPGAPPSSKMAERRPAMTVLSGDDPRPQRRAPPVPRAAPTPAATGSGTAPELAVLTAALKASGASSDQVDASMKLVEAMRSQGSTRPTRTDDRLNLGDLTFIALSTGQNRIAASGTGSMAMKTRIGSLQRAMYMHPSEYPKQRQDDGKVMDGIDGLVKQVMKHMERLKKDQTIRTGHDN